MVTLEGYCPDCPRWFAIPDPKLKAYNLCPCCLHAAAKVREVRSGSVAGIRQGQQLLARLRRMAVGLLPHD